jgi:hypothetical protein
LIEAWNANVHNIYFAWQYGLPQYTNLLLIDIKTINNKLVTILQQLKQGASDFT